MVKITLLGNPVSTNIVYRRHGNVIYMSKEGRELKESYQWQVKSQWKQKMIEEEISISIDLYFKDKRRRDWDNWHKLSMDALTGIVWKDDSQIVNAIISKNIDKENPRIEINLSTPLT